MNENTELLYAELNYELDANRAVNTVANLREQMSIVKKDLETKVLNEDKLDYAVAIGSGVLAGIIDSFFVGELDFKKAKAWSNKTVNEFIMTCARHTKIEGKVYEGNGLKGAIRHLEDKYPMPQDNAFSGANIGVTPKSHHLDDIAHHPTVGGLVAAIFVQFFKIGLFQNKDGENHIISTEKGKPSVVKSEIVKTVASGILSGIALWIVNIVEDNLENELDEEIPAFVRKLINAVAASPAIIPVLKAIANYGGHLVSDMGGSKNTPGGGMGIPGVFISVLKEISMIPGLNKTNLPKVVNDLYVKNKIDLRFEIAILKMVGDMTVPVIVNEVLVRGFFFIRHLVLEYQREESFSSVDWRKVIPFNNRNLTHMLAISSVTFSTVDAADAALRAAIESKGVWAAFAVKFALKINYVGTFRTAVALVGETAADVKELEDIQRARVQIENLSADMVRRLEEYQQKIREIVEQYMVEHLQAFLEGTNDMDEAITANDSDRYIYGNVVIQRVLGREPQFTNQKSFNKLMKSNDALIL